MAWDPTVLRKYNSTGHFRLLNQLRSELKSNPLVRPKEGERIADVNRSRALVRALEGGGGGSRGRRGGSRVSSPAVGSDSGFVAPATNNSPSAVDGDLTGNNFRDRLDAVELR